MWEGRRAVSGCFKFVRVVVCVYCTFVGTIPKRERLRRVGIIMSSLYVPTSRRLHFLTFFHRIISGDDGEMGAESFGNRNTPYVAMSQGNDAVGDCVRR